jgi:two-component system, LuxR family, response regulator FixJ
MKSTPTVYVVDDDAAMRASLRRLFTRAALRVETFGSARAFLAHYDGSGPACLVLDVYLRDMSGLELQCALAERRLAPPIIFIAAEPAIRVAVDAMRRGAVDFLQKPLSDELLLQLVREALARDARALDERRRRLAIGERLARLSPHEREVMELVVTGKSNTSIARLLGTSTRTVEARRARVMEKMEAGSLAGLIHLVLQADTYDPTCRPQLRWQAG